MASDKNWDDSRKEIAKSSEALVEMITTHQPSKKSVQNRKGPKPYQDLAETAGMFFRTAADVLEGKYQIPASEKPENSAGPLAAVQNFFGQAQTDLAEKSQDALDSAGKTLDKTGKQAAKFWNKTGEQVQGTANDIGKAVKDAKLDKKLADAGDKIGKTVKDAKLDKKLADTADNVGKAVKDAKLDQKFGDAVDNVGKSIKDAKLDKKLDKARHNIEKSVKDAKLDKKLGKAVKDVKLDKKFDKVRSNLAHSVQDLEADKKAAGLLATVGATFESLGDNLSETIKDAKLDKKLADVTENIGQTLENVGETLGDFIKDAHLDKKLADVTENVSDFIKDAHLDKKLAGVSSNVEQALKDAKLDKKLAYVTENIGDAIKDAKLDKKLADVSGTLGETFDSLTSNIEHAIKDAKLDKKLAGVSDTLGETFGTITGGVEHAIKDAKLDKKLADASDSARQGVAKLGKDFKKNQAKALKEAKKQQRKLGKEAGKLFEEQRDNLLNAANTLPFVNIEPPKKKSHTLRNIALGAGVTGAVVGGLAARNSQVWNNVQPLESKLPGENRYFRSRRGIVFYKEAGTNDESPVVFVHGIGAGNHSYEWLQNFETFSKEHKVYAFDLLGFGNSERRDIVYTAELYIEQLMDFLEEVVKKPAHIVASSLAGAYAIQVAYRRPELISKLVLMSPTGINREGGKQKVGFLPEPAYNLLRLPVLDKTLYDLAASQNGIRSFMQEQMFFDKSEAKPDMIEQYHTAAHQPGAQYAPASFFTGKLDASLQEVSKIKQPILAIAGKYSRITDQQEIEAFRKLRSDIRVEILDQARLSVNWERAQQFNRLALDFLNETRPEDEHRLRPEPATAAEQRAKIKNISHLTRQANSDESERPDNPEDTERKALG